MNTEVMIKNGAAQYSAVPDGKGIIPVKAAKGSGLLTMQMEVPILDINGYWHPDCRWPSAKLNFNINFKSAFNRFWPMISFFAMSGHNRCTVGITDLIDDCDVRAELDQTSRSYVLTFTVAVPENEDISFELCIDTSDVVWTEAVSGLVAKLAEIYPMPQIPDAAWDPVYCTWYATHAAVTQAWIDEAAPKAAELGMKTLIVDDGWSFPEMRRVKAGMAVNNWYKDIGDWELCKEKFPDFSAHLARIHHLGMKYMLWLTPFLIGIDSKFAAKYTESITDIIAAGFRLPKFNNAEASEEMISKIVNVMKEYGIDGLKIDFIDKVCPSLTEPCGRKIYNFMNEMIGRLREVKPDILIEFREVYCHRAIAYLGTQYRAADVPLDWMDNLRRLSKIHMELGSGFPAHSDPVFWHKDELNENISRHMMAAIAGVPMVSIDFEEQRPEALAIVRHWLEFYRQHLDTFRSGKWQGRYFGENLCYLKVSSEEECIVFLIDDARFFEVAETADIILNLSPSPLQLDNAEYFDCFGEVIEEAASPGGALVRKKSL